MKIENEIEKARKAAFDCFKANNFYGTGRASFSLNDLKIIVEFDRVYCCEKLQIFAEFSSRNKKFIEILYSDSLTSKQIEKLLKDILSKYGR